MERNITCSTSAESHSLAGEGEADSSSHQQQLSSAGDEGDEGSCELSDEVSRDSTMGSDSDTFSSPFCLSPVSEALCESSGSVFLDSESRSVRGLKQTGSRFLLGFIDAYILPASHIVVRKRLKNKNQMSVRDVTVISVSMSLWAYDSFKW